jgi:hypothetical protein
MGGQFLSFSRFLMGSPLFAGRAELFEVKLSLNRFLVLAGVIIHPSAFGALEPDEIFGIFGLCHAKSNLAINGGNCKFRHR